MGEKRSLEETLAAEGRAYDQNIGGSSASKLTAPKAPVKSAATKKDQADGEDQGRDKD